MWALLIFELDTSWKGGLAGPAGVCLPLRATLCSKSEYLIRFLAQLTCVEWFTEGSCACPSLYTSCRFACALTGHAATNSNGLHVRNMAETTHLKLLLLAHCFPQIDQQIPKGEKRGNETRCWREAQRLGENCQNPPASSDYERLWETVRSKSDFSMLLLCSSLLALCIQIIRGRLCSTFGLPHIVFGSSMVNKHIGETTILLRIPNQHRLQPPMLTTASVTVFCVVLPLPKLQPCFD